MCISEVLVGPPVVEGILYYVHVLVYITSLTGETQEIPDLTVVMVLRELDILGIHPEAMASEVVMLTPVVNVVAVPSSPAQGRLVVASSRRVSCMGGVVATEVAVGRTLTHNVVVVVVVVPLSTGVLAHLSEVLKAVQVVVVKLVAGVVLLST